MRTPPCLRRLLAAAAFVCLLAPAAFPAANAPMPLTAVAAEDAARQLGLPAVNAATFRDVTVVRDLAYARRGEHELRLDLFLPNNATAAPRTCVVVIAGGGFLAQPRTRFGFVAAHLAAHGFAAVSIDYRGAPGHTFLATLHDTQDAVRWVRAHAREYHLDPARVGAIGQSAGGHLAAMLAVSADAPSLQGPPGTDPAAARIQAAVSLAGVFDFISRLKDGGHQKKAIAEKRRSNGTWVGEPFTPTSRVWRDASPINHISAGDAPVLFLHCRGDDTAPFEQSVQMFEALRPASPRSKLVLYEVGGHNMLRVRDTNEKLWSETLAFFQATLRPE